MRSFRLLERVADGLVRIKTFDWVTGFRYGKSDDDALWSRVRTRKETRCAVTRQPIPKGAFAYRPVGNQSYRMVRIRADIVDQARPQEEIA